MHIDVVFAHLYEHLHSRYTDNNNDGFNNERSTHKFTSLMQTVFAIKNILLYNKCLRITQGYNLVSFVKDFNFVFGTFM